MIKKYLWQFLLLASISLFSFGTVSALSAPELTRSLELKSRGSDVVLLQDFLTSLGYFKYPTSTGYFGTVTQTAVKSFQCATGIICSGDDQSTGYGRVGPLTRTTIKSYTPADITQTSQQTTPTTTPTTQSTTTSTSIPLLNGTLLPGHIPGYGGGSPVVVQTPTPDTTAPVISAIATSSPTATTLVVTWTTDEPSTSVVDYGATTSYGLSTSSPTLTTSHTLTLTGLDPKLAYQFRIKSSDSSGNIAVSSNQTSPLLILAVPTGFNWSNPSINIYRDLSTDFDASTLAPTGKTYYVNDATGNDSNPGTLASPLKSIYACYHKSDAVVCSVAPGWYTEADNGGVYWTPITRDISIIGSAPGVYISRNVTGLSWTQSGSHWSATQTTAVTGVLDTTRTDSNGDFVRLSQQSSLGAVDSTPDSWYWAANVLYVNTTRSPDSDIRVYTQYRFGWYFITAHTIYLENQTVVGGDEPIAVQPGASSTRTIFINKNVTVKNSTGDPSSGGQGLFCSGFTTCISQNLISSGNRGDAINYGVGGVGVDNYLHAIEINATAGNQVYTTDITGNGSTSHGRDMVIRIGGHYSNTYGPIIADVGVATQSWNIGINASTPLSATNNYTVASDASSVVWLDQITSTRSGDYDFAPGGTVYGYSISPSYTLSTGSLIPYQRSFTTLP